MKNIINSLKNKPHKGKPGTILGGESSIDEKFNDPEFLKNPEIVAHNAKIENFRKILLESRKGMKLVPLKASNVSTSELHPLYKCPYCGECFPRSNIDNHVRECLSSKCKLQPELSIQAMLFSNNENLIPGLDIFKRYIENIILYPNDPRFLRIRTNNKYFIEKIKPLKNHEDVFKYLGFSLKTNDEGDEAFFIDIVDTEKLNFALKQFETPLIMKPKFVRNYQKYFGTPNVPKDIEISKKDFDITANDIAQELNLQEQKRKERDTLMIRNTFKESHESAAIVNVRIRFPDTSVIESIFESSEPNSAIYCLIFQNLVDPSLNFVLRTNTGVLGSPAHSNPGLSNVILCDDNPIKNLNIKNNITLHFITFPTSKAKVYLNDLNDEKDLFS